MSTMDASGASLAARLERAEREMRTLAGRAHRGNWLTLLLGLAVLAALTTYFWFGYNELNRFLQPDELVGVAQGLLDEQIPQVRSELETQVKASAPELAKNLSQQLLAAIPQGRVWLAETVVSQIQEGLDQSALITLEQLRDFLRRNKDLIERDLRTLSTSPTLAEAELDEMVKLLEAELGENFRNRAFDLYETANGIQEHLDQLASGSNLSERDRTIRRILSYLRLYQIEATGDRPLPRPGESAPRLAVPALPQPAVAPPSSPTETTSSENASSPSQDQPAPAPTQPAP
ncbi:MAG: hypothetical protein KatS3mg108_3575 [Isosphaeraceae bacterium]|nr:MAG: hypothetical protein KatS3mg108_3575 [Isosphaeraceae bacterium]